MTHIANSSSLWVIKERNQIISRVRNNSTEYTSNITTNKAYSKLQAFATLIFGYGNCMLVYHLYNCLKWCKLHHCIWTYLHFCHCQLSVHSPWIMNSIIFYQLTWNLSPPKRYQPLVQPVEEFAENKIKKVK